MVAQRRTMTSGTGVITGRAPRSLPKDMRRQPTYTQDRGPTSAKVSRAIRAISSLHTGSIRSTTSSPTTMTTKFTNCPWPG
ncbi:hypothetical protein EMCG_07813 [[Emmonsia] crescens]|uniref:Uncharacterized protein n=1 Tax=[Emmonsia] crescens TaxID=73230 RepID=A0A0G2J558_9EURO|nr:hypothetical protein EMCG_07813 [Emmonsia crescens UAMH 3008]